jgi:hypothetical protein
MTIVDFVKVLKEAVDTGDFPFHVENSVGFKYTNGKRQSYYTNILSCHPKGTEGIRLSALDVVCSQLAGEIVRLSRDEMVDVLCMDKHKLGMIVRACSEIDIYEPDGSMRIGFSRKLRKDIMAAVRLKDVHIDCRPHCAFG